MLTDMVLGRSGVLLDFSPTSASSLLFVLNVNKFHPTTSCPMNVIFLDHGPSSMFQDFLNESGCGGVHVRAPFLYQLKKSLVQTNIFRANHVFGGWFSG
jgi:hypothetical protein